MWTDPASGVTLPNPRLRGERRANAIAFVKGVVNSREIQRARVTKKREQRQAFAKLSHAEKIAHREAGQSARASA